jgi:chemotaxis protein histidine kinase CheA
MPEEATPTIAAPTPATDAVPVPTAPAAPKPVQQTPPKAELKANPEKDLDDFFAQVHNEKKTPEKPAEKPQEQPETTEAPAEPAEDEEVSKFTTAKNLREAYTKLKKEHAAKLKEFEEFQKRPAAEDPEKPKLLETLSAREARLKELEDQVKYHDYTKSSEYLEKYDRPYKEAWQYATQTATDLSVKRDGTEPRKVSAEEFARIVNMRSEDDALEAAHSLFDGDKLGAAKAARIMEQREKILTHYRAAENAKSEFAKNVEARERELSTKQIAEREAQAKAAKQQSETFQKLNGEAKQKYPQWFSKIEGDDQINKSLESGERMANFLFSNQQDVDSETRVRMHSAAYMKIAGFDRLAIENGRLKAQAEKLQKALDGYKNSGPGNATGKGGDKPVKVGGRTLADALGELDTLVGRK